MQAYLQDISSELVPLSVDLLSKGIAALAVVAGFWIAARIVQKILRRVASRTNDDRQHIFDLLAQTIKTALIVFGVVTALGTMGINVNALVAGLGLTGFALGFALKDAISNLLAGVLILIYRPFYRGDLITVKGFEGKVINIDLRYTTLEGDARIIYLPNSDLFTNAVIVHSPAGSRDEEETVDPG
jgi:small-conductance mechanosensitive channel